MPAIGGWRVTRVARVVTDVAWWASIIAALVSAGWVGFWPLEGAQAPALRYYGGMTVLTLLLISFGLQLVRALLRDVLSGDVFTAPNARRIGRLGWLLVVAAAWHHGIELQQDRDLTI